MPVVDRSSQRATGDATQSHTTVRAQYKGKKVKLKSGGPEMTVNEVVPSPLGIVLACAWFDDTRLSKDTFSLEAVELVP
ncbi:DUF2158 domain-containing protein [Ralstonia chuxiongensis]|uniref:DUF2158 domain-containing protein n=1 Tax=Ralstonia chuxiongensis TaxID=2957504 RepID=UPI003B75C029